MSTDKILHVGFNQDFGKLSLAVHQLNCLNFKKIFKECFTCGLDDGYRIYNTNPLKENAREGIYII
jgi:hypothetical protein